MTITLAEARDYLRQPLIARLATIEEDGTPHIVPVWYVVEEDRDEILIMTDRSTHKVSNALARNRGAVQVGGDATGEPNKYTIGYLLQGEFTVTEDENKTSMKRITRHYVPGEQAEELISRWMNDDVVELRLKVRRVVRVM